MTTRDAVRNRLGLGRLLPLGTAADGAWLTEEAAVAALRVAGARVPAVELGRVRLSLADPETAAVSPVPPPPSALPPGALRIEAGFSTSTSQPLPLVASQLREALWTVATQELDLLVEETDLQVTGLLDPSVEAPGKDHRESPESAPPPGGRPARPEGPAALAASAAPGVAHLTATLGSAVHLGKDHLRVEVAITPGHRPLAVVAAVRQAVLGALGDDGRPVVVLVTNVSAG
ncbi:hypothetical protein [Streptomyces albipurpureus]|uniref:Nucleopolyhedrovirus P10 family protein n=1 Tax=Streptomyces albipurpureus TaxID=2897419 RepID=A0ABT0UWH8_9ACTN|nr:hypothetical protein [Streptomyces sp. CWNU-1]MCM2391541.1 hypothetical protein [Streptomyces sp. CWNU-1]